MIEAINAYFSVYTAVFIWLAEHIFIVLVLMGIPAIILGIFLVIYSIPLLFIIAVILEAIKFVVFAITGRKYE